MLGGVFINFNTDNINYVDLHLLEGQCDLLLQCLELYAFNFHKVWATDLDSSFEDLRNSLLYHTYHEILCKLGQSRYRPCYDLEYECKLSSQRKKRIIFYRKKNLTKNII